MKRTETIAYYRDAFLSGRNDAFIKKFESKSVDKQYQSIMSWKQNQGKKSSSDVNQIITMLRDASRAVSMLPELSTTDSKKIIGLAEKFISTVEDFKNLKKIKELQELKAKRSMLEREIALLESTIVK